MQSKNKPKPTRREREHIAMPCSESGCSNARMARGFCGKHYMRLRRAASELLAPRQPESDRDYLAARVLLDPNGCWVWMNSKYAGYGRLERNGRRFQAHVFSYLTFVGPVPIGLQINHKCHNRACCNPRHLYAGTQKQNVADTFNSGRAVLLKGERNGNSKLTTQAVLEIIASDEPARVLRRRYQVSDSIVRAIRKGIVWKHLNAQQEP